MHWFYNIQGPRGWFVLTLVILNCCHSTIVGWIPVCYYSIPIAVFRKLQQMCFFLFRRGGQRLFPRLPLWSSLLSLRAADCFSEAFSFFSSLLADLTDKSMPLSMWRQAHVLTVRVEWGFFCPCNWLKETHKCTMCSFSHLMSNGWLGVGKENFTELLVGLRVHKVYYLSLAMFIIANILQFSLLSLKATTLVMRESGHGGDLAFTTTISSSCNAPECLTCSLSVSLHAAK